VAGRWMQFGLYGANAIPTNVPGKIALAQQLDELVTGIASPVDTDRGLHARLRYLTHSDAGYDAMARAGIDVTPRTLMKWLAEEAAPNHENLQKIDAAYWDYRRHNVAADLKRRLNRAGAGTRVEIYPIDQSTVDEPRRRPIQVRSLTVRDVWDDAVDAWINEDLDTLDIIWDEIITDLDSDYDAYSYVSAVGFGA
jgi:hypothetical protein